MAKRTSSSPSSTDTYRAADGSQEWRKYVGQVLHEYAEKMWVNGRVPVQVVSFGNMVNVYGVDACKQIDEYKEGDRCPLANALAFDLAAEIIETGGL